MTIRNDVDELIEFLNSIAKIDPVAVGNLVSLRVPCNDDLADHPSVQVSTTRVGFEVGLLGLLNGYAGIHDNGIWKGYGPVCAIINDDGSIAGFKRLG